MAILPVRKSWASLLRLLVVCAQVQWSYALSAQYCSTQNTGGGASPNSSIYQSNGLCHDTCLASYAFAIVQGQNCWCSNYAPAAQGSTSKCNTPCPGFPDELCGNSDQSLYGYISLNVAPSGTLGVASSSTAASSSQVPSATSAPAAIASSTHQAASASQSPTHVTQVQVVTQSGQIITQTITTTPTVPASPNTSRKNGIAPGYVAAAVIAGLLGLVFIVAGIWLFMRRKENKDGEKGFQGGSSRDMQRNISVHSKAGLLANRNGVPAINTRNSGQPLMDDAATTRLNPNALMANDNGSKTSLNTIDDHRDYGRTLQVTNPDPTRTSFS
ncbi:hypothetical protein BLS_003523 [Venturia inaequalis]|uniref:WSC domain-containing protein n=1 Tax=Venturia inaequalis TaxID=5025 RepID=A0A8H3V9L2_VENIN|nr:hypothetical protein BLS_003523 [Venturia inaequalis]